MLGLSHIEFSEKIIQFFIYFILNSSFADSKQLSFPVEVTSRRVLRVLEIEEAICELVDDEGRGDIYTYLCVVQATSNQTIKNVKIVNEFKFSSQNYSIATSVNPLIEQYLDNIQEIGNKFNFLSNSTLYTLENSKIAVGEKQIFNISGIINGTKPKFEKVDLNLSVSTEYANKKEVKQLECKIIDIIENNYTLNCMGMKNTNYSLENAFSVIEDEILIIRFGENEKRTILFYSDSNSDSDSDSVLDEDENKYNYPIKSKYNKSGGLGGGAIVGIILACLAAAAAVVISIIYLRKRTKREEPVPESTIANLQL